MKQLSKYWILVFGLAVIFSSCKKQDLAYYSGEPSIYFTTGTYNYSFTEDLDAQTKTIYIPVALSGNQEDFDRHFTVEVVNDTNTTAQNDWYEIEKGELLKNKFNGRIGVVLKRNATVDASIVKLRLRLLGSNDLNPAMRQTVQINWTGQIIEPVNWSWLRSYFGTPFSTNWYKFMLKEADVTYFAYGGNLSTTDPVTWWWTIPQVRAYAIKVKEALLNYNLEHPGEEMKHEDGLYKDQLITMP